AERDRRGGPDEVLELLVLGDEIGLAVDLDDRALAVVDGDPDQALGRGTAGFLGGGGEPLGAEPVDRGLHLAAGLAERLLAIHHAGAGALAQFLHGCGRNLSHVSYPLECAPASAGSALYSRRVPASAASAGGSSCAPI